MRLDMALEHRNYKTSPRSNPTDPILVRMASVDNPSPFEHIEVDKSKSIRWSRGGNYDLSNLESNSIELSLKGPSSPLRQSTPSGSHGAYYTEDNQIIIKRASMYQCSREMRKSRKQREGRRKDIMSRSDERFLSFEIVDALSQYCQKPSLLFSKQEGSPLGSSQAESSRSPKKTVDLLDFRDLPDRSFDSCGFCLGSSTLEGGSSYSVSFSSYLKSEELNLRDESPTLLLLESGLGEEQTGGCIRNLEPENDEEINYGKEMRSTFSKSFSVNYGKANTKTRVSPLKKMLDPILKSKSTSNSSPMRSETPPVSMTDHLHIRKDRVTCKSLLNDLIGFVPHGVVTNQTSTSCSSPVHMHGALKLETEHGPSFEFSLKDPELFLSAKAWKTSNYFSSVYTFHKNKISSNSSGVRNNNGQACLMVGQMHISCHLCSEADEIESTVNSIITEFILYDIPHSRGTCIPSGSVQTSDKIPGRKILNECELNASDCYPWTSDLNPHQEIAAIIIQAPFIGSLGLRDMHQEISDDSTYDKMWREHDVNVKVVAPSGRHGLPNTKGGPSSLLDRWRSGGGCECGGWDIACPIVVFDNSGKVPASCPDSGSNHLTPLFFQGRKEESPAITILASGRSGEYSVSFHAQLSALQAFAICIAMLYASGTSSMAGEGNKQRLRQSNSLKFLLEEELRLLIGAVAKKETTETKERVNQIAPSFRLDPPFSPIGRI